MPTCINLRERFGDRYRIAHEESYYAERPEFRAAEEVWLQILPCQNGHICPWGGSTLAACTNSTGPVAKRLKALPFAKVAQDGDDGANVLFDVEHFDEVAEVMKPRKRRRLSAEQKAANVERLQQWQFQPQARDETAHSHAAQHAHGERPCDSMAPDDSEPVQGQRKRSKPPTTHTKKQDAVLAVDCGTTP